jgi:hypothetical protein
MSGPEQEPAGAGRSGEEPDFSVESVEFPSDLPPGVQKRLIRGEERSARRGAMIGALVIVLGILLLILGASGAVELSVKVGEFSGHLVTGALGIVVVLLGGFIIWATRQRVKVTGGHADRG